MSTATLGLVGSRGPSGGGTQVPSAFVTFTTLSDWVAYRHPSKPTTAKSPRVPPVKMFVSVGGLVVRSILVMIRRSGCRKETVYWDWPTPPSHRWWEQ